MSERPLPPKPVPNLDTQPFWDAIADGRLTAPRCTGCGKWIWQPKPICPDCHSPDLEWLELSGRGTVASWTVLHPPVLPVWADKLPITILLVEAEEGIRILGQLVDADGELLQSNGEAEGIAMGRRVAFRPRVDEAGQTIPAWTVDG